METEAKRSVSIVHYVIFCDIGPLKSADSLSRLLIGSWSRVIPIGICESKIQVALVQVGYAYSLCFTSKNYLEKVTSVWAVLQFISTLLIMDNAAFLLHYILLI